MTESALAPRGIRSQFGSLGQHYLSVIIVGIVTSQLVQYLAPNSTAWKGQGLSILLTLAALALAVALCFAASPMMQWSGLSKLILISLLLYWGIALISNYSHHDGYNYTAFVIPVVVIMLWLRPVSYAVMRMSVEVFAWSVLTIAVVAQVCVRLGWVAARQEFPHRFPLLPWLGQEARWEGPFGNVNYSGPIGAFLFVYALTCTGAKRWILLGGGVVFLFASESRGAFAAAIAGLLVYGLLQDRPLGVVMTRTKRLAIVGGILAAIMLVIAVVDPTMNGRATIWNEYLHLWPTHPWFGFSQADILATIADGRLSFFATHGHNLFFETLISAGILGLLALLCWLALGFIASLRAARMGMATGFTIFAAMLVSAMDEDLYTGIYLSVLFLPTVLAVLVSMSRLDTRTPEAEEFS